MHSAQAIKLATSYRSVSADSHSAQSVHVQVMEVRADLLDADSRTIKYVSLWTEARLLAQAWNTPLPGPYPQGISNYPMEGLIYALTGADMFLQR